MHSPIQLQSILANSSDWGSNSFWEDPAQIFVAGLFLSAILSPIFYLVRSIGFRRSIVTNLDCFIAFLAWGSWSGIALGTIALWYDGLFFLIDVFFLLLGLAFSIGVAGSGIHWGRPRKTM